MIAALATITGQYLLNRREPFAIMRIKRLSEAIDSLPEADAGRSNLDEARTVLAQRLARSLIGPRGLARVLRAGAWISIAVGAGLMAIWFYFVGVLGEDPTTSEARLVLNAGIGAAVVSPTLLLYSVLWPYLWSSANFIAEAMAKLVIKIGEGIVEIGRRRAPRR